jgi:CRISPR-associated endonuclease/helicase Cas3
MKGGQMVIPDGGAVAMLRALIKREPYNWQKRLLCGWLLAGRLPAAIDIPTGLGKTTTMAVWLAAFGSGARLPRRLVYVVDRRAVVDQATEEADKLAEALGDGSVDEIEIATLRETLGLRRGQRLPVSTLRGQHVDNREWLENPAAPVIVVGTVDMIGSRLLFEGYGIGPRMRPVQAALIGADSLLMLDEAHLVPPFEALLRSVAEMGPPREPVPRFHLTALSATGRGEQGNTFRLEPEDWDDPPVRSRLEARKRLRLFDLPEGANLAEILAGRAEELGNGGNRVLVFCNSRKIAQKVGEELSKKDLPIELLVGARRVHEREKLKDSEVFRRFGSTPDTFKDKPAEPPPPAFLVATSAGEVGVDLDADHIVCDLVPWERMIQRLGRVNRRADSDGHVALIDVFCTVPDDEAEDGADNQRLERWRAPFGSSAWPVSEGRVDVSSGTLHHIKDDPELKPLSQAATSDEPLRPMLTQPLLDAWSMTSLAEHPGRPEVEPWLRGWIDSKPQTQVLWRGLLPIRPGDVDGASDGELKKRLTDFFEYAPPHLSEIVETLTSDVVETIQKRAKELQALRKKDVAVELPVLGAVTLSRRGGVDQVVSFSDLTRLPARQLFAILAGRTAVLDARLGGLSEAGLLDAKIDVPPMTIDGEEGDWGASFLEAAGFRVRRASANDKPENDWRIEWRWRLDPDDDNEDGAEIRVEVLRQATATSGDSAIARKAQGLYEHHDWTAKEADAIASRLGLPETYRKMLIAAAAAHDAGKARELWQRAMRAPREGRPYAKTEGGGIPSLLEINGETYRHEFGSLRNAHENESVKELPKELRELALHLIAAHHGFARPFIAPIDPDYPPSASAALAREAALRFARLQAYWGVWGLAWWEALLRAADWAASRALNEDAGAPDG